MNNLSTSLLQDSSYQSVTQAAVGCYANGSYQFALLSYAAFAT
jgi:hypothetical protein